MGVSHKRPYNALFRSGDGNLFDLNNAPYEEFAVLTDSTDPGANAAREKLQTVLDELKSRTNP